MRCVLSCANWDNGSNAGSRNRNLNNNRTNANNNVGFACDSMPNTPYAACADWQRGSLRRALRRNVMQQTPLVAVAHRVVRLAKIGFLAILAFVLVAFLPDSAFKKLMHWMRIYIIAKAIEA